MTYSFLTEEQARRQADVVQLYKAWREAAVQTWNGRGGDLAAYLAWRKRPDTQREYLVKRLRRYEASIGPRSLETEAFKDNYDRRRGKVVDRMTQTYAELRSMARVNKAMRIARMPKLAADIIRQLDEHGLLGPKAIVIGSHALYAYEAAAGVHIRQSLMETRDLDFFWDTDQKLSLAISKVRPPSVFGLLRKVDKSFEASYRLFARNRDGFEVELLTAQSGEVDQPQPSGLPGDQLDATPYAGLEALIALPRFEAVAIDAQGMPVRVVAPEPRAFALHKEWVSKQPSRNPLKRGRDREQSQIVKRLAIEIFGLSMQGTDFTNLPQYLRESEG